jgi:hypothetical protein
MPGRGPSLSPLAARKQLLLAESEINRALLLREFQTLGGGVRSLSDQAKSLATILSTILLLASELLRFSNRKVEAPGSRPSWFRRIARGANLAITLWLALRAKKAADATDAK